MYVETLKRISKSLVDAPCTAIIAGGAVRDIDNRKPYKDIDIFCLYNEDQDPDRLVDQIGDHIGLRDIVIHNDAVEYQENWNGIHSVWDGRIHVRDNISFDVQLIFQKMGEGNVYKQITDKFDLNICQAAIDYDEALDKFYVLKSDGYKRDKENGTITLTQHGLDLPVGPKRNKTRTRARRIGQKLNFRIDLEWDRRQQDPVDWGMQYNNPVRDIDLGLRYAALIEEQNRLMRYLVRPVNRVPNQAAQVFHRGVIGN